MKYAKYIQEKITTLNDNLLALDKTYSLDILKEVFRILNDEDANNLMKKVVKEMYKPKYLDEELLKEDKKNRQDNIIY